MSTKKYIDLADQIKNQLNIAFKRRDAPMFIYYQQMQNDPNIIAFASYETFKGSWAYQEWYKKNRPAIDEFVKNNYNRYQIIWSAT